MICHSSTTVSQSHSHNHHCRWASLTHYQVNFRNQRSSLVTLGNKGHTRKWCKTTDLQAINMSVAFNLSRSLCIFKNECVFMRCYDNIQVEQISFCKKRTQTGNIGNIWFWEWPKQSWLISWMTAWTSAGNTKQS